MAADLHKVGVVLHFHKEPGLTDIVYLQPHQVRRRRQSMPFIVFFYLAIGPTPRDIFILLFICGDAALNPGKEGHSSSSARTMLAPDRVCASALDWIACRVSAVDENSEWY